MSSDPEALVGAIGPDPNPEIRNQRPLSIPPQSFKTDTMNLVFSLNDSPLNTVLSTAPSSFTP